MLKLATSQDCEKVIQSEIAEKVKLEKQVKEMKTFLGDYGLVWVGKDRQHKPSAEEVQKAKDAVAHPPMASKALPKEIDTEVLTKRIEELNFIAEKQRVINNNGISHFKKHDGIMIFFFKNGLIIKGFPFYHYASKEAQSVLSDILDGFFPWDLKKKYPDGVPLKPVDCTDEDYNPDSIKTNPKFANLGDLEKDAGPGGMSKDEFL